MHVRYICSNTEPKIPANQRPAESRHGLEKEAVDPFRSIKPTPVKAESPPNAQKYNNYVVQSP